MVQLEHEFYKAREVAALLRMNTKTLYGWIKEGKANALYTPTGGIRISRDEVLRLVEEYAKPAP